MSVDERIVAEAAALRDWLRDHAEASAAAGGPSKEINDRLVELGVYKILHPRRYGGLELSLETFARVMVEISRGDPGTGWNVCLAAGHVFQLAAFFPEETQEELLGGGKYFAAPGRTSPTGKAVVEDGGYRISGRWDYCSGITHATHLMGVAVVQDDTAERRQVMFVVPREQIAVLDDWGGGATIGMEASGSNTVVVEDAFIPERYAVDYNFKVFDIPPEGTIGYQLHKNPLYLGRTVTFFNTELVATQVGAAQAALDEYEKIVATRRTSFPPPVPRTEHPNVQTWLGEATSATDAAAALLFSATQEYARYGTAWQETGREFTVADDVRLRGVILQGARLAHSAVDLMFSTGGTSAAKRGSALQRYFRDVSMFRTHIAAQYDYVSASTARLNLGQPLDF